MPSRKVSPLFLLVLSCVAAPVLPAAEAELVATPRARLLPVTPTNQPFLAAANAQQPVRLASLGYAESELLVHGYANIYEWTGAAAAADVSVRAANVPWATRVLVRRPVDPAKASGLVVVELLNPTGLYDFAPLWGFSWQHFTRRGDVWVGVTVKPVAAEALRRFDPVRYGGLSFAYKQPPQCQPQATAAGLPGAGSERNNAPDSENGLAFDIIAQVGALLRSSSKENPLLDINPWKVVAAGYSQTGGYITTFANALHAVLRRGDGAPIYDGYLNAAGAQSLVPLNQCAAPLAEDDPRRGALPRDVPFVTAMTESDFTRGAARSLRRADSDDPRDLFRLYEIPGAGHAGPFAAGVPSDAELKRVGLQSPGNDLCVEPRGDYPVGLAFNAIWQQYADWLTSGTAMAQVPRIEAGEDGAPVRDEQGNAVGGWRLPQIDLPLASYSGRSTPRDDTARAATACQLTGSKQPFDAARLKSLYRTRAAYQQALRSAVDQAVQERRLVREDGEAVKTIPVPAF